MKEVTNSDLEQYFINISRNHKLNIKNSGFEINDRSIFKNEFLKLLGYDLGHILDDVSQKVGDKSKSPDLRLYGEKENKSKNNHSQFVIETKNYGLLEHNVDNIDYKQLKNYIISNKSKIRIICSTDYVSMFVFNATEIKKQINIYTLDKISNNEINKFKNNLLYEIHFDNLKKRDLSDLKNLCYKTVFAEHKFITPTEFEELYSIQDSNNRNNFISNLFQLMKIIESDIKLDFYDILEKYHRELDRLSEDNGFKKHLIEEILKDEFKVMKSFLIWGSEMNYIIDVITNPDSKITKSEAFGFFDNNEYQEAFILTSVYNLINKTFFIRILEDSSTEYTTFIRGMKNNRYLSNGILQYKINESEESLIQYLKDVYEFSKPDLKQFSFLLRKDIYSWVLDWIDSHNLISFIRLFNDISFRKLNQDILGDIYEHYLEQDKVDEGKSFRRLLGQYYTPKPIVRLMWFLVRDVLKKIKNRDLYQKSEPYLNILDPAYGSGTFLYEAILHINQSEIGKPITKDGKVWSFIKVRDKNFKIEDHIFGFEINPLSKSIADLNLFFGLIQIYGINNLTKVPVQHLNIYRTNSFELALKNSIEEQTASLFSFMADDLKYSLEEKKEIIDVKKIKYDIIIANPPYGHITPNNFMKNELIPFAYASHNFNAKGNEISFSWGKKEVNGKVPENEKNRGKLRDMYAFFFGVADRLLDDNGILCYITSNTYLSAPTYKWMRKYWLENYEIHYIINFNKIGEKSNSMFFPEAGISTAIIVMSKKKEKNNKIRFLDLSELDSIPDKYNSFSNIKWNENKKNKNDIINFEIKSLNGIKWIHKEQNYFLNKIDYILSIDPLVDRIINNSDNLDDILEMKCGIVTGDHKTLVDKDKDNLIIKITNNIINSDDLTKIPKSLRSKLHSKKDILKKHEIDKSNIFPFVFERQMKKYYNEIDSYVYYYDDMLWRAREKDDILNKSKLIVYNDRATYDIFAIVTERIIIPEQSKRSHYYISQDTDLLYFLAAVINSNLMLYVYKINYGLKIIPIKRINEINSSIISKIVILSQEIHKLKSDNYNFINNIMKFKSDWFNDNILHKINIVSILDGSELWDLKFSSEMINDYYVSNAKIDTKDNNVLILNAETKIVCRDKGIAKNLFNKYLKHYDGDLSEKELVVNITEFQNPNQYNEILKSIDEKCLEIEEQINDLVFEVYDISEKEKNMINKEIRN